MNATWTTCGPPVTRVRKFRCASAACSGTYCGATLSFCPASRSRRQREHLLPHAVDADLHLVRLGQPLDQLVAIAREAKLELIFAVGRKRVPHARAGARAERLAVEVIFLREVRRKNDRSRRRPSAPACRRRGG